MNDNKKNNVILFHDHFLYKGGAERLCIFLINHLKCDVATFYKSNNTFDINTDKLIILRKNWPGKFLNIWKCFYFIFKTTFLNNYKKIIFSGDSVFASIFVNKSIKKIYYCHTPPRYLYDQYDEAKLRRSIFIRWLYIIGVYIQRFLYVYSVKKNNIIIVNSLNTQNRLKKNCNIDSIILYPPIDTNKSLKTFSDINNLLNNKRKFLETGYYLSFARLDRLKRVDVIIEAFKKMPHKNLVIISSGPEEKKIIQLSHNIDNIYFFGSVSDDELLCFLKHCVATIYIPINEDFGMTTVESMAIGKPIIAVADGGIIESMMDEVERKNLNENFKILKIKTGILLNKNFNTYDLCNAIYEMTNKYAISCKEACISRSKKFNAKIFLNKFDQILNNI